MVWLEPRLELRGERHGELWGVAAGLGPVTRQESDGVGTSRVRWVDR